MHSPAKPQAEKIAAPAPVDLAAPAVGSKTADPRAESGAMSRVAVERVPGKADQESAVVDHEGKGQSMLTQSDQPQPGIQFKVGDKAVYPRGGVAEVIGIEELDIAGNRQRFYVLRLLQNNSKIRVPVGNASAVGLRQLISEQEIQEVFDILRERTIAFDKQTWNRRYRGFMDKIKTGSIYDVAEVLRDLYRLKTDKQLSFGEKRMLDEARSLIVKEIAITRGQTEDDVKNEIEAIFLSN